MWYKPIVWNQGAYDAVYLNHEEGLCRFVQVTIAKSHDLKVRFIERFLSRLAQNSVARTLPEGPSGVGFVIKKLEIVILYPKGYAMPTIRVDGSAIFLSGLQIQEWNHYGTDSYKIDSRLTYLSLNEDQL
jgi:hypothetical protein